MLKNHAKKMNGGVEVKHQAYLSSALDGGEWSASGSGRLTSVERATYIHWIEGWVDSSAILK
jgi:hypothetical protein